MEQIKYEVTEAGNQRMRAERFVMGIAVLAAMICLMTGVYCKYRYRLDKPVFVRESQILSVLSGEKENETCIYGSVTFHYITGKEDKRMVRAVEFLLPDVPEGGSGEVSGPPELHLTEMQESIQADSQYILHILSGKAEGKGLEDFLKSSVCSPITKACVTYTDGSVSVEELGYLMVVSVSHSNDAVEMLSAGAGSEGWEEQKMRVRCAGTVRECFLAASEEERKNFAITVNGVSLEEMRKGDSDGLKLQEGEKLTIRSTWTGKYGELAPLEYTGICAVFEFIPDGDAQETEYLYFNGGYTRTSGNRFVKLWRYLKEKGVF